MPETAQPRLDCTGLRGKEEGAGKRRGNEPVHRCALHVAFIEIERKRASLRNERRWQGLGHECSPVDALEKGVRSDISSTMAATADKRSTRGDNQWRESLPAQAFLRFSRQ
jgi:hypothetical protein